MSVALWLASRQIRDSLRSGNPDEARQRLMPFVRAGHRRAHKLLAEIAGAYVVRAKAQLSAENDEVAWKDLLSAESLNVQDARVAELRATLTKLGASACRAALLAGKPLPVIERIGRMKARAAHHPDFETYESVARDWLRAMEAADRGDFAAALGTLERAKQFVSSDLHDGFDLCAVQLQQRYDRYRDANVPLFEAAQVGNWAAVLKLADEVTSVAPEHREARNLRERAWSVLRPDTSADETKIQPVQARPEGQPESHIVDAGTEALPRRFLLWIDGVGGYLVCLGSRIGFGQATATQHVDVPLLADVSRLHAELNRDAEGYVLESGRDLLVNGQPTKRAVLSSGDRVTLGATCQFVFHQPVPISPSARLELVSGHRLPIAVDGILLMAENLLFGSQSPVHVPLPESKGNVVIFRSKDGLSLRCPGPFRLDGRECRDRAVLPLPCYASADSWSFAIEPVGQHL